MSTVYRGLWQILWRNARPDVRITVCDSCFIATWYLCILWAWGTFNHISGSWNVFVNINLVFSYFPDAHTLNLEALVIWNFCEFEHVQTSYTISTDNEAYVCETDSNGSLLIKSTEVHRSWCQKCLLCHPGQELCEHIVEAMIGMRIDQLSLFVQHARVFLKCWSFFCHSIPRRTLSLHSL